MKWNKFGIHRILPSGRQAELSETLLAGFEIVGARRAQRSTAPAE
jgi:hypothetical protein